MYEWVQGVASMIAAVQAQVAKDAVVWRSGPLVMAPLVKSSLAAAQVSLHVPLCLWSLLSSPTWQRLR